MITSFDVGFFSRLYWTSGESQYSHAKLTESPQPSLEGEGEGEGGEGTDSLR